MKTRWCVLLAAALFLPLLAMAGISVDPRDRTVTPGLWCGNYEAAKTFAEQNDLPLVFIWGKDKCGYCKNLRNALGLSEGLAWASDLRTTNGKKAVFCIVEGTSSWVDVSPNVGAKEFASGNGELSGTPFVCIYWLNRKTERFSGQTQVLPSNRETDLDAAGLKKVLEQFAARVETSLGSVQLVNSYATFPFGDTVNDRLEAIAKVTQWVDVPVVRTNEVAQAATNHVDFTCGTSVWTAVLDWQTNETRKTVRYELPETFAAAGKAEVVLKELGGSQIAKRQIVAVGKGENSAKNPLWLGEKVEYGQWSMDLDAVTNLVRTSGGHAMVLIAGSRWCPDCAMADRYFFDDPRFRTWAVSNKVALGVVDIPNNPTDPSTSSSLLVYDSYRTSDAFVTLRGTQAADESLRYQSGAGFLSRHSAEPADVEAVIRRNLKLVSSNTLNGGWNRPERANQVRPGVPILVMLRADGSICGRWNPFATTAPTAYSDGYLRRFEEIFAQAADGCEEYNDDWRTTTCALGTNEDVCATLSAGDAQDVYRLTAELNTRMVFRLTGELATQCTLAVSDESGEVSQVLAESAGSLSDGVCVTAKVISANCYLKVSYPLDGDGFPVDFDFALTNGASTVRGYRVEASGTPSGGEIGFADATVSVWEDSSNGMQRVAIRARRVRGACGAASVRLSLVGGGDGARGRIEAWGEDPVISWTDGEDGEKVVYLTVYDNDVAERDLCLEFALSDLSADVSDAEIESDRSKMRVIVLDDDANGVLVYRNVASSTAIEIEGWREGATVLISRTDGSAPSGLNARVENGFLKVVGTPRDAGDYLVSYRVRVILDGKVLADQAVDLAFTVRDADFSATIPSLDATRTYANLPVVSADGVLRGLLTVTVPRSGRLSAKYVANGRAVAYSAAGWSVFDEGNSWLQAELSPTGKASGSLIVTFRGTEGMAEFADPEDGSSIVVKLVSPDWSETNPADAWAGQYTVQLPQTNCIDDVQTPRLTGVAYMAMRMTNAVSRSRGAMLYAGVLPNGQTFSGTSVLLPEGAIARLPFYQLGLRGLAPYAFSGEFALAAHAKTSGRWGVTGRTAVRWETEDAAGRHEGLCAVYGGYYDKDEISTAFANDFASDLTDFYFHADAGLISLANEGAGLAFDPVAASLSNNVPVLVATGNPQRVKLAFSPWTGVVSGSLCLAFDNGHETTVTYRGIALPGWQKCDDCSTVPERPWAAGACSFSDTDGRGLLRLGCEIKLDHLKKGFME